MIHCLLTTLCAVLLSLPAMGQEDFVVRHGDCTPPPDEGAFTRGNQHRLPPIHKNWDPDRTYRQMVILIEFSDQPFNTENPREFYERMFNEQGFNVDKRNCKGCVADYYRDQSGGMLNLQFDIFGPVKVSKKAQPYDNPTENTRNYGRDAMIEATQKVLQAYPDWDYTVYDWNGNGSVNQVIFIHAGVPGNLGTDNYGHIWPNTSSFSTVNTPDGKKISSYSVSGEHWPTTGKSSCGIGTVCHEFTHSLGLPDLYKTNTTDNIVLDTWDLMDGGNFVNWGFCPPNYSPLEKILLGWLEPVELTEAMTEEGLDYGKVYKITNTDKDYYLVENRKQEGWDEGVPGEGLVIFHVLYDYSVWSSNAVNNGEKNRYDIIHADGLDYYAWQDKISKEGLGTYSPNKKGLMMNYNALSGSPFPYIPGEGEAVTSFTDLPEKALTNIQLKADGTVSFDFMGGATPISTVTGGQPPYVAQVFDITGRQVDVQHAGQIYIVRQSDGTFRKYIAR